MTKANEDKKTETPLNKSNVEGLVSCPVCKREWPEDCEQSRAVNMRGKCIVCIADAGERIEMNPYEFRKVI